MDSENKKKSFLSLFNELTDSEEFNEVAQNGHPYSPGVGAQKDEAFAGLTEELDHQILMHRDSHFGGDFQTMIDYYQAEGIGVYREFDLDRITYLAQVEKELGQNLAALFLTAAEAQQVAHAKKAYLQLKAIYELESEKTVYPRLIADLILTEAEDPEQESEAIIKMGIAIVPDLIRLIQTSEFYDPLFPGYGIAPSLAIYCLGQIKAPEGLIPIFETLNKQVLFEEETTLEALAALGSPAKEFLLKTLKSRPITQDNENAAFALTAFAEDDAVAKEALSELQDEAIYSKPMLATYLLCSCTELRSEEDRIILRELGKNPKIPEVIRQEIQNITQEWE